MTKKSSRKIIVGGSAHTVQNNVEVISDDIVFLLDDNGKRLRQICGYVEGTAVCLEDAGKNTDHEGTGRCAAHEEADKKDTGIYKQIVKKIDPSKFVLKQSFDAAMKISEEELSSVDDNIKSMYAMEIDLISRITSNPDEEWTADSSREIIDINEKIAKLKKIKAEISSKRGLPFNDIMFFLDMLLTVLLDELTKIYGVTEGEQVATRVMQTLLNKVVVPASQRGKVNLPEVSDDQLSKDNVKVSFSSVLRDVNEK